MIVNFEDYLFEELLNESLINEELNLDKINNIIKKISNKGQAILKLIKKINDSDNFLQRKHLATILVILFFGNLVIKNNRWNEASAINIERAAIEVAKEINSTMDIKKIENIAKPILVSNNLDNLTLKKPPFENIPSIDLSIAKISNSVKEFIKEHENLRLTAYSIGDGMVTIGYGHAEPEDKSKYKVGDDISQQKAEQLFNMDIKEAEDGVKRLLKYWDDNDIDVKITQSMFDSMVSMAYNMGVSGFRSSEFVQHLKNKDYLAAAEKIKTTRVTAKVKDENGNYVMVEMPGLLDRRLRESELFIKDIS